MGLKEKICNDCKHANWNESHLACFCENIDSPVYETYNQHVTGCYACEKFEPL